MGMVIRRSTTKIWPPTSSYSSAPGAWNWNWRSGGKVGICVTSEHPREG